MGPRLGRVEYLRDLMELADFNVASMGPRLGRVEYNRVVLKWESLEIGFNGATLRTRGIRD